MITFAKKPGYYQGVNMDVYNMIEPGTKRILDVGCGTGALGKKLKDDKGAEQVMGIEVQAEIAREASEVLDKVYRQDVETMRIDSYVKHFDCIVMSGILHHLKNPWAILKIYKNYLKDDGYLVAAIPNIAHISILRNLLLGKWEYSEEGILDVCHMKFFTLEEMTKMFHGAGFVIEEIEEQLHDITPENQDLVQRLSAACEVGTNFGRDSFVLQYITKWKKAS